MNITTDFKPKDLSHYLGIAFEILHKAHIYTPEQLTGMMQELADYKSYRESIHELVPSHIDAAIAAGLLGIGSLQLKPCDRCNLEVETLYPQAHNGKNYCRHCDRLVGKTEFKR